MVASRLHFAAPLSSVGGSTSLGRSYRILKSTLLLGLRMILSNSREDVFHRVFLKYGGCEHRACEHKVRVHSVSLALVVSLEGFYLVWVGAAEVV